MEDNSSLHHWMSCYMAKNAFYDLHRVRFFLADSKSLSVEIVTVDTMCSMCVVLCRPAGSDVARVSDMKTIVFPEAQASQINLQPGTVLKIFPPW